jgi:hypothetical protein
MITKINGGVYGPRKGYFFPEYDLRSEEEISPKQKRQLTDYIMSLHNDSDDEMSACEADDLLCSVSQW